MIGYRIRDFTETPVRLVLDEDTYSEWSDDRVRSELLRDAELLADQIGTSVEIQSPDGRELITVEIS